MLAFGVAGGGADHAYAEQLQACDTCHGEDGNSKMEKIPSLAGQPAFYIFNQLFLMREGVRKVEAMAPFVKDLKDERSDRLSKHFAGLPAKPSDEPIDPALAKRGAEIANAAALRLLPPAEPRRPGPDAAARQAAHRLH